MITPSPANGLEPRRARDIISLGQEVGRVLSDGRIVGRAEPFAKVFPSSRLVKRAVGTTAWCVLEDIALDARLDDRGRLVAETNARRIAHHLGLNKGTVVTHLGRLREYGFIFHEELRQDGSGRYDTARYVLDSSACLERFTHTPGAGAQPCTENPYTVPAVDGKPVDGKAVHGEAVHGSAVHGKPDRLKDLVVSRRRQQQDRPAADDELRAGLERLGVARAVAAQLVACHPADRVGQALEAAAAESVRDPAAWVVRALRDGWDFAGRLAQHREAVARQQHQTRQAAAEQAAAQAERDHAARAAGWCAAVSAALDDASLDQAVALVTTPAPGLARRSVPLARAQLLAWAVAIHRRHPDLPLSHALTTALADDAAAPFEGQLDDGLPEPPAAEADAEDLAARIAACLRRLTRPRQPPGCQAQTSAGTRKEQP